MGLFDLFKRKRAIEASAATGEPRFHHYALAHVALRQIALHDPLLYLSELASSEVAEFLASVLDDVCRLSDEPRRAPPFTAADLKVHCVRAVGFPCGIVEMPQPLGTTEAYYTALVLLVREDAESTEPESAPARYFTLEKGFSLDGISRTTFAEWTMSSHLNYGDGSAPTLDAFVAQVSEAVAG